MTNQVVSQQLHDQGRVLVALLAEGVKLRNGIIESLFSEVASLVRRVEYLVVEDREVEGETKADRVGGRKIGLSDLGGSFVGLKRLVGRFLSLVGRGELGEVAVVVALPVFKSQNLRPINKTRRDRNLTSCGRRPWIHRFGQRQSSACREPQGCPRRSFQAPFRLSGGIP